MENDGVAFNRKLDRHLAALSVDRAGEGNRGERFVAAHHHRTARSIGPQFGALRHPDPEAETLRALLRADQVEDLYAASGRRDQGVGVREGLVTEDALFAEAMGVATRVGAKLGDRETRFANPDRVGGRISDCDFAEGIVGLEPCRGGFQGEIKVADVAVLVLGPHRDPGVEQGAVAVLGDGRRRRPDRFDLVGGGNRPGGVVVQRRQLLGENFPQQFLGACRTYLGIGVRRFFPFVNGRWRFQFFFARGFFAFHRGDARAHLGRVGQPVTLRLQRRRQGLDFVARGNRGFVRQNRHRRDRDEQHCKSEDPAKPGRTEPSHEDVSPVVNGRGKVLLSRSSSCNR